MPDFIAGFIDGITEDYFVKSIEYCYVAVSPDVVQKNVVSGINFLRKGTLESEIAAAPFFIKFMKLYPQTLTTCDIEGLTDDEAQISAILDKLQDPEFVGKVVTVNYLKSKAAIDEQISDITYQWDQQYYEHSGESLGALIKILTEPVMMDTSEVNTYIDFLN